MKLILSADITDTPERMGQLLWEHAMTIIEGLDAGNREGVLLTDNGTHAATWELES